MSTLVIGYGSPLRGDDAVGLHVAEAVEALALPGVEVRALHQLAPELALDLGAVDLVVFVDADVHASEVTVRRLEPSDTPSRTTHHMHPGALLALTGMLGEDPPLAVTVGVPASDLGLSLTLSPATLAHVDQAVAQIVALRSAATDELADPGTLPGAGVTPTGQVSRA